MDISAEIAAIQAASQGAELRQPLVGALNKLNTASLPAVTVSDMGKILKVGANGWEVGEKSGYMPVPSASLNISSNGTHDVTDYAEAVVNVQPSGKITITQNGTDIDVANYALADVSVSGGAALIQKTITQNGTYDPADDNADGYNEVIVNVSGGDTWPDDYIESSGTQYIDTGYYPNDNTDIEIIASVSRGSNSYPTIFGMRPQSYSSSGSHDLLIHFYAASEQAMDLIRNTIVLSYDYTKCVDKKTLYKIGKNGYGIENELYKYVNNNELPNNSVVGTYPLFIFNLNNVGTVFGTDAACIMKLYRFRIYESGILVHEFIPWKDTNDVVCLKDTVTGDLKYNAGTGTFTYGTDSNS